MKDFDLIIFDCDGTLTDSEYVNNQAVLDVLREEGITQYDLDHAYRHWLGTTLPGIALAVQMETGRTLPGDFIARCLARGLQLQEGFLNPVPDARDLVAAAAARHKICVASNGEQSAVERALEKTGFMAFFRPEWVFTKTLVKNPKPYPDLFLYSAARMDAAAERCLVIEDSAAGVRAGVAAGMTTFGFTGSAHDPARQEAALKAAGATAVFARLIHIKAQLGL